MREGRVNSLSREKCQDSDCYGSLFAVATRLLNKSLRYGWGQKKARGQKYPAAITLTKKDALKRAS